MGVSITDLITLAKAGYTPAQVKELITLSEKAETAKPEEQPGATAGTSDPATESPEPIKATENEEKPEDAKKEEIDYKELFEKAQEDLKKAQEANRNVDASKGEKDPTENLKTIFASYY